MNDLNDTSQGTWLTKTLGIRYPVIQGAFHGFGTSELAGPVSAAGGLGIITAHNFPTAEALRVDIRRARELTSNPIGINFSILPENMAQFPSSKFIPKGASAWPGYIDRLEAALDEGVRVIFTSAYDGTPLGLKAKEAGAVWIHKAASIRHALAAARKGADAVVAFGLEGAGFKSPLQNTTMVTVATLRKHCSVPVIACGGIGNGQGLVAALALGACGVYLGTAFMATQECPIPKKRKQLIVEQDISDPVYHSKAMDPLAHMGLHSMASGTIDSIPTVEEFINRFMAEADETLMALRQQKFMSHFS